MRVLVVEDDPVLADGLRAGLMLSGATVDSVDTCEDARAALASSEFAAMVLDIMLPDGSGVDLLREVRRAGNKIPVLLLTARDAVTDRISGLDAGADDYLGKPFDLDELNARLRAITRRAQGHADGRLIHGSLQLDTADMTVFVDEKPIALSRREFAILLALMERPGAVRSRSELEDRLYGWQDDIESNAVEVHIHNLRTKVGREAVETLRGVGYRMRPLK